MLMEVVCSQQEFDKLLTQIRSKVNYVTFQARGASMFAFIKKGDWLKIEILPQNSDCLIRKGDVVLFKKQDMLFLHRVIRINKEGFLVKADASLGSDGVILPDEIIGKLITIQRGRKLIDLDKRVYRLVALGIANLSNLFSCLWFIFDKLCMFYLKILHCLQKVSLYRKIARMFCGDIIIRQATTNDQQQLRDLYRMAGIDVQEGLSKIKLEGFWLVAQRNKKIAAAVTISASESDPSFWLIFGLEVKPWLRGMGIGKKIIQHAISMAKERGAKKIGLFVSKKATAAVNLYRSLGFIPTEEVPEGYNRWQEDLFLVYSDCFKKRKKQQGEAKKMYSEEPLSSSLKASLKALIQLVCLDNQSRSNFNYRNFSVIQWQDLLKLSIKEGLFFPFWQGLQRYFHLQQKTQNSPLTFTKMNFIKEIIPEQVAEEFMDNYYHHLAASMMFSSAVESILNHLENHQILTLLMKGPTVDNIIYGDYLRSRGDLDIVVKQKDWPLLTRVLENIGYFIQLPPRDYPLFEYQNSLLFLPKKEGIPIHLHNNLFNNLYLGVDGLFLPSMEKVWQETIPLKNYQWIRALQPEMQIIYLCEHAVKHNFEQLVLAYEIQRIILIYANSLDWNKLVILTQSMGLTQVVYTALEVVRDLFNIDLPVERLKRLQPKLTVVQRCFLRKVRDRKISYWTCYPLYLSMRKKFFYKLRFIWYSFFPPGFPLRGYLTRIRKLILAQ
ncbi:MAG: GNAT family N-acetyltransferase [Candidatus Omnitrophica bacterium]|nr:GNAT family N-acetyltransferase [Candidatus Omnitrophota bacterium]